MAHDGTPSQCIAKAGSTGKRCLRMAIPGGVVCKLHGGQLPKVREAANRRYELSLWGLADRTDDVDPVSIMLRLIQQSAARAELYATYLHQAMEAVETPGNGAFEIPPALLALTGLDFRKARDNDSGLMGEAVSRFEALEARERRFLLDATRLAISSNLAERQVRVAEVQGAALVTALLAGLDAAGLTPQQKAVAQNAAADALLRQIGPGPSAGLHVAQD